MMTLDALAEGLNTLGLPVRLEPRDRQLVIIPLRGIPDLSNTALREEVLRLARSSGFSHVSLEIVGDGEDASLYRDQSA